MRQPQCAGQAIVSVGREGLYSGKGKRAYISTKGHTSSSASCLRCFSLDCDALLSFFFSSAICQFFA